MNRIKFWTFILACMALHACGGGGAPILDEDNPALPDDPTSIELFDPSSSPGTDATPTLKVSGVTSGDKISIFTNSLCKDPPNRQESRYEDLRSDQNHHMAMVSEIKPSELWFLDETAGCLLEFSR